ncbi:MAG TPA: hypothetical protein VGP21_07990 [Opitutaceae bacterium]|jgi:hypothetical protein|nr:hypothetical protein [Opitutaceae bacterium]
MPDDKPDSPPPAVAAAIVRYSLPAMLAELKLERTAGGFAQEKIAQSEISKLFAAPNRRRDKSKK